MKRALIAVTLAAAVAAGGCGTATHTHSASQTAWSQAGYFDMNRLASDLQRLANRSLRREHSHARVTSVSCIRTGRQTAECYAVGSDGSTNTDPVDIAADGSSYITH